MVNRYEIDVSSADSADDILLAQLCDEFTNALRKGENVSVDDYVIRHPLLAKKIQIAFPALRMMAAVPVASGKSAVNEALPTQIARFDIVRLIGRGGMGVVYEATHPSVSRRVAIKVLKSELIASESFSARFRREAEAASRLNHPNIVPFIDYGEDDGTAFMSMLYIDGESLDHVLERHRDKESDGDQRTTFIAKDFTRIAKLGACVASALAQAHQQRTIHRDIKPANLILDRDGKIWVTDFGLAKLRDDDSGLSSVGDMIGTPSYMAPEQIRGIANERSDIYSLGITLYELATGVKPWHSEHNVGSIRDRAELPPIQDVNPDVPAELARIIRKACHPSSNRRHKDAAELQFELNQFAHGGTVADRRSLRRDPMRPSWFRDIILATALLGSLTIAALLMFSNQGRPQIDDENIVPLEVVSVPPTAFVEELLIVEHTEGLTSLAAIQLTGSDPDGIAFSWELLPDDDANCFIAQSLSGHLCFRRPPMLDDPQDKDADNVYQLSLRATDLRQPHVAVFMSEDATGEIYLSEPAVGTKKRTNIPRQLMSICTTDGITFLHAHLSNDGTVALYKSIRHDEHFETTLLQADCHLTPFVTSLAQGNDSSFVAVQRCREGFELQRLRLDRSYQFHQIDEPIPLENVTNPVGFSCLGDGDFQLLDVAKDGVVLQEMAISENDIAGTRELPVGWSFEGCSILGMAAWANQTDAPTTADLPTQQIRIQVMQK